MVGVRCGFVSIRIGPSLNPLSKNPLVDAIEVYAQERKKIKSLLTVENLSQSDKAIIYLDRCRDAQPIHDQSYSSFGREEERYRLALNQNMLALTHLYQLLGKSFEQSSCLNQQSLHKLIQLTALDSHEHSEVRVNLIGLLKEIEGDKLTRQMIVDEKTLSGVAGVLRDLKLTQPKDSLSRFGKVSSNKHHKFTNSSLIPSEVEKLEILSTINECIKSSLSIIQNRPENYRHSIENLSSIGSIEASVANEAKDTLNIFGLNDITPPEIVGNLVKLALMEMTVAEETLCVRCPAKFAGIDLISEFFKSHNLEQVKTCCNVLSNVEDIVSKSVVCTENEEHSNINNPPPIAYQCDSCGMFPITGTRHTLEEGHDIDLCRACFLAGCQFSKSKKSEMTLEINGKRLHIAKGKEVTCAQIHQMRPMAIADRIVEQGNLIFYSVCCHYIYIILIFLVLLIFCNLVRMAAESAPEEDAEDAAALQIALKMSLENENNISIDTTKEASISKMYSVRRKVFDGILALVSESLSVDSTSSSSYHLDHVVDLLLSFVWRCEHAEEKKYLGKIMCKVFCDKLTSLTAVCLKDKFSKDVMTISSLVICLRSLVSLLKKKDVMKEEFNTKHRKIESENHVLDTGPSSNEKNKNKTDSRFVCETHNVSAVRRRCVYFHYFFTFSFYCNFF